ncbi:MAG: fumarylacetoacetate hydrolase, partial [Gaiellaceae bacterium]|nr:fumarylacetoacetate hydrolase [Gaiellaceae bacterium]
MALYIRVRGPNGVEQGVVENGQVELGGGMQITPLDPDSMQLPEPYELLTPLAAPEIWCAGVTYERSRDARVEESTVKDVYSMAYDAPRPELFMKDAAMRRTVAPGRPIGIRDDSWWNVPEPEIGVVLGTDGRIAGYTIGNDVSSRDIEGANPLYLPQAKIYAGACSFGPAVFVSEHDEDTFRLTLRVRHGPRPARRIHAPARPLRRDPRPRDRHARQSRRARLRADAEGARLMTDTMTGAPARNYVGGEWHESAAGATYEKRNPWRPAQVTGVYPASDAEDARAAIEAASEAFPAWSSLPAGQRAATFTRAAAAIEARAEQVAQDMTAEMGKPLREARLETLRAATILRYAAGEAYRPVGEQYEPSVADQRLFTLRRPLGVVGLITPWNFPIAIPVWKL